MNENTFVDGTFQKIVAAALFSLVIFTSESEAETATYEVIFDASWSRATHPYEFPGNPHFSGLIGGTHNDSISFWNTGGIATDGIESMAETGGTLQLQREVEAAIDAGNAESVVRGPGIGRSPNAVSQRFEISEAYSLVTLVSMIAPSPDWFVGTSGLDLRPDGEWLGQVVYDLLPYDAGTDSGLNYTSSDQDTSPAEVISQLTDLPFDQPTPLGTFTFRRVLDSDFNQNGAYDAEDIDQLSMAIRDGSTDGVYDVNKDGMVSSDDRLAWLENAAIGPGDSNFDGSFDSGDLVSVFQAGEYEDLIVGNSGWQAGDFNGDGESDSGDLVLALQLGGYEGGELNAVPEPAAASLLVISLLMFVPLCRSRGRQ